MTLRILFNRFVGRYRDSASELASLNDSGFESPSAKRIRLESELDKARLPLVEEIEEGYSLVYLARDRSLTNSYRGRYPPPVMDSPTRIVRALNISPNFTGGLRDQITRMGNFRRFPQPIIQIDLSRADPSQDDPSQDDPPQDDV